MEIKPTQENLNRYVELLFKHDFYYLQSDDHRFLEQNIDQEKEILKLREVFDKDHKIYNVYNPFHSK